MHEVGYEHLIGVVVGSHECVGYRRIPRVEGGQKGSKTRPIFKVRDRRCGHTFETTRHPKYWRVGRYRNCGCPVRFLQAAGYFSLTWRMPNGRKIHIQEHRLVMESIVGRELLDHEEVHHKNGDRSDNRPGNLELWSVSQPRGQRVEDKLAWALEIVALYDEKQLATGGPS